MNVEIEAATQATSELVESLNRLVPQLSSSAEPLTLSDVEWMVSSDVVTLYVARHEGRVVGTLIATPSSPSGRGTSRGSRTWWSTKQLAGSVSARPASTMAAVDEARRRGVRSVDLTSRPAREAANALYQKLGFGLRETNVYRFIVESDRKA